VPGGHDFPQPFQLIQRQRVQELLHLAHRERIHGDPVGQLTQARKVHVLVGAMSPPSRPLLGVLKQAVESHASVRAGVGAARLHLPSSGIASIIAIQSSIDGHSSADRRMRGSPAGTPHPVGRHGQTGD